MTVNLYVVGGYVRDRIMGVDSKDIDFSVEASSFEEMEQFLVDSGFKIFVRTPQFFTIRAHFPKTGFEFADLNVRNLTADFVLCRRDGEYTDGRRPDEVFAGTLKDDLARRDFTMNAVAMDRDGNFIDPFNGMDAIASREIRGVGHPIKRIREDALRAVRAIRFSVTKNMRMDPMVEAVVSSRHTAALVEKIAPERVEAELKKMFAFDTLRSLEMLHRFPLLTEAMLRDRLWLTPTMKGR